MNMNLQDYERKHMDFLLANAGECTLFLKRDGAFPLERPGKTALYGNGARNTVKGGTGSGDVTSRLFMNCEQGLKEDGFEILTGDWLDSYDAAYRAGHADFVREVKAEARRNGYSAGVYSMGFFQREPKMKLPLRKDAELAVYVLARNSGEGNDRRLIPGDVYLTEDEIRDILELDRLYEKFVLVLNVGGPVDLSPVLSVRNILYLSQLGAVTGSLLGKILLGKIDPSGKLSTTWADPKAYATSKNFGDLQEVQYQEGIYVGYRYFDSAEAPVTFPFGFGLSYSDFRVTPDKDKADLAGTRGTMIPGTQGTAIQGTQETTIQGTEIFVRARVQNLSDFPGKEVVQLYWSKPQGSLDQPYQELVAFQKTEVLGPREETRVTLSFDVRDFGSYDPERQACLLEKGTYILRLGNSSRKTEVVARVVLSEDILLRQCQNKLGDPGFKDLVIPRKDQEKEDPTLQSLPVLYLDPNDFETEKVVYGEDPEIDPRAGKMSDEELMLLCMGHHGKGFAAMVGSSCVRVLGGAGETVRSLPAVPNTLAMADGPAGLRLKAVYGVDQKGVYDVVMDTHMEKMMEFFPGFVRHFLCPPKNRHGELHYQYTSAIPVGTALAQSFNSDLVQKMGDLVGEEMEIFDVDLWLAPALNLHRNILCGRNFEYFSEDPYLSGIMAAAMTKGVQSHPGKGVTIKHFFANNQELNRNNANSRLSERAARELYLRGFELCIKKAGPKALMTSYNLVNGVHTSESFALLNDILRREFGFDGLVMTDWIQSGRSFCKKSLYPAPYASNNLLARNELTMSGSPQDEKDIRKALKTGKLTRQDLLINGSRVLRAIDKVQKEKR